MSTGSVVMGRRIGLVVALTGVLAGAGAAPSQAAPSPFKGYSASISLAGSKSDAREVIARGACGGGDRTLSQKSTIEGELKLGSIGSGLFSKPSGSLAEVMTTYDSAAGCHTVNQVDTPVSSVCDVTTKQKFTPSDAGGFLGVSFQKSGGSYIVTALSPQFAGSVKTSCSPEPPNPTAAAVGPALGGFSASLKGRVSANNFFKHRSFTTTLLPVTATEESFDKYMCGDPDGGTICQATYGLKITLTMTYKR